MIRFISARRPGGTMKLIGAGALVVLGLVAHGCGSGQEAAPAHSEVGPDEVLRVFQRTESRSGRVTLGLNAKRGDVYDRDHRVELVTMRVDFYGSDGALMSTLIADSGHVDTRTEDMQAFGHVRVEGQDGAVLTTSRLAWLDRDQKIRSDDEVTIRRDDDEIRGRGFIGEPSLKTYQLLENVRGQVSGAEVKRADSTAAPADTAGTLR